MSRPRRCAAAIVLIGALIIASCSAAGSPAGIAPTDAVVVTSTAQPSALPTIAATDWPTAAPTAPLDLPTPAVTITPAPTAAPFPLAAGWWDDAVCYEVFVRSFYDSNGDGVGDLNGLIEKLDYINDGDPKTQTDLGASCIWLMPIAESPSYHGYDVVDYYQVDREYGSNDDFKRLVAAAHQRGIKVLVDLVLNHTARDHPWFQAALADPGSPYRDWYLWSKDRPRYAGPWGQPVWHRSLARDEYYYGIFWEGMPDLNYRNPAVIAEAHKISAFWLKDLGVDGFRLDAVKHIIEDGSVQENTPETIAWLREYRTFLTQVAPDAFTIGEVNSGDLDVLAPYYPDQLDSYFEFDIGYETLTAADEGAAGAYLAAVGNANRRLPFQRWAPFLTNHDQERVMSSLGDDSAKAKIAAIALLTLPGLPFIYYGEEIGMLGTKPDERIRTPMQWSGEEHGGFSTGQPWESFQANYREVNVAAQDDDPGSLLNLYRRLVHLNTEHPALGHGSFTPLVASSGNVAAFLRQADGEAILVVLNFGQQPVTKATLTLAQSELASGSYQLQPLLGEQPAAALTIGAGGALTDYAPLETLAPRTGYIFKLTAQAR
jgi:alpha-amylase